MRFEGFRTAPRLRFFLGIVFFLALTSAQAWAQSAGFEVTVPAGGTVELPVEGYCMDYGKPFPSRELVPLNPAPPEIRALLEYAYAKGYTDRFPHQVQRAVWYFTDRVQYDPKRLPVTHELVRYGKAHGKGAFPAGVLELTQGVKQGLLDARVLGFHTVSKPPYRGKGTLRITNKTPVRCGSSSPTA